MSVFKGDFLSYRHERKWYSGYRMIAVFASVVKMKKKRAEDHVFLESSRVFSLSRILSSAQ